MQCSGMQKCKSAKVQQLMKRMSSRKQGLSGGSCIGASLLLQRVHKRMRLCIHIPLPLPSSNPPVCITLNNQVHAHLHQHRLKPGWAKKIGSGKGRGMHCTRTCSSPSKAAAHLFTISKLQRLLSSQLVPKGSACNSHQMQELSKGNISQG